MLRPAEFYPENFFDMSAGIPIPDSKVKEWINFIDKCEKGSSINSGDTVVFKTKDGAIIVAKNYLVLDKAIVEEHGERAEALSEQVEDFINRIND